MMQARLLCVAGVMLVGFAVAGCGEKMTVYTNDEGKFQVLLPGEPTVKASTIKDHKVELQIRTATLQVRSGRYAVTWYDLAPTANLSSEAFLDLASQGAAEEVKGIIDQKKTRHLKLDGKHQGRAIFVEGENKKIYLRVRFYLVGRRAYNVLVSGDKWWVESESAERFLTSFALSEE